MSQVALLAWIWLGCAVFVLGCAFRAFRYLRAPDHLRWDLYPVAHDPRRDHGGSHLEEKDWWTKPRKTNPLGEVLVMGEEILLLLGVFKNNRRLWWGSLPFHWGLYLMVATTLGLLAAVLGVPGAWWRELLSLPAAAGGGLLALGSLVLLWMRAGDPRLRPYTTPLDLMNLALLAGLGVLSLAVALTPGGMDLASLAVGDLLRGRPLQVPALLAAQMATAALFLGYLPATRMIHFFSKYFTYHLVRWDDRPRVPGSALDRRLAAALNFGVSWAAPHIQTGHTWVEVASNLPAGDKGK
ncbi:MAG TPA: respiratory nitrate reductase subunit gamma [Vicinamibacteria bacterium]|nr:respiratory nitrate reductase subunit gamma [Vicinamibacteria bacterium]